ncbi:unnamed protein product [Adineta steineri]|uniref:Poly [ADP-ribose] polymerase n=1 Tax=Adineta steineri TaxID=433720 RepID=A0A815KAS3_9BILA|nr:unnamed protein product [Adineta steineri]CAF1390835.1 unnamed protein product [Adineta steineri]
MAEAIETTDPCEPSHNQVSLHDWSLNLSQHFHNDKCQNVNVEKEFIGEYTIDNIPCEYCDELINFDDWERHSRQCAETDKQRIEDITNHGSNNLIPCEFCSLPVSIHDLMAHTNKCAEVERQRIQNLTKHAGNNLIPCEYCSIPIDIDEWNLHTNQCAEFERQRIQNLTKHADSDLIPCEYCNKSFTLQYIENHQTECRQQLATVSDGFNAHAFNRDLTFPETWNHSSLYNLSRYILEPTSEEYKFVANNFHRTLPSNEIVQIERIQNRRWYRQYDAHRDDFIERYGKSTEQWLFHGCKSQSIDAIINDCFNRSHAVRYAVGQGIYFATDASISLNYTQPSHNNTRHMFMARVLVGRTTKGDQTTRICPRGYDTTGGGTVFVTYHDAQAYGEYLIAFT